MTDDAPTFDISCRPKRAFPREGGIEYEGGTVFRLSPDDDLSNEDLTAIAEDVLTGDRYTYGDWFDLPAPVYLVHDEPHSTAFRVVIRHETVQFHILPDTDSAALRELYRRLRDATDSAWQVERETTRPT